jgi:hypothetical protein
LSWIESGRELAYRELDDALGLTEIAIERLADARTGRNARENGQISPAITVRAARGADSRRTSRLPSTEAGKALTFTPVRKSTGNPGLPRVCGEDN